MQDVVLLSVDPASQFPLDLSLGLRLQLILFLVNHG